MPDQQLTTDQQSLSDLLASYNYYLNPGMYTGANDPANHYSAAVPATSGLGHTGNAANVDSAMLNVLFPGLGSLLQKKSKPPQFQPYVDSNGNYQWTTPTQANPVPLSDVPGASVGPSKEYQDMANQVRMLTDLLPQYSSIISSQKIPDAMGQLAADTAVTGPRLALQEQLQRQYGPIFDQLGIDSAQRRGMGSAQNDLAVMQGPGKDLVAEALSAAKLYDPEYFKTRTATSDSLGQLLSATTANLGKGLSATEADAAQRQIALESDRRGTANSPSNLDTVANATQFGQLGHQREMENQNQLSKAISASTAFLPQSRSNVDVFQVATGKPSYNQQDSRFNTNNQTGDATNQANALLNTGSSMWTTNTNNALTRELNQTNWMDTLSAITGAIGSVGGAVGGAMMCWVAREVYGSGNYDWMRFRHYLLYDAPRWQYKLYMRYGERFAAFIADKPKFKNLIRRWMNSKIK